ncbi:gamma-glutamylcyclotransferase [Amycolatopsis sp. 195334CR]|uniref:gamma-glutamylcyclotransferase n=1 Tax=Amycolatopsis sp. 195334CR TaxID=2814588 RepID=UPI0027DD985F|nr:gamma-glutamylcyclotransferase [Amycolatopsis sp. 195334CR]
MHVDGAGYELPDPPDLDGRIPVLAYGSNACPSKITWLRRALGLTGAVTVLQAKCTGLAAVWASGRRVVDDQRPATLAAMPGVVEEHAVWLATPEQLRVLDVCEGRGHRYHLARVHTGEVTLANGASLPDVLAYVAASPIRLPLLVDGKPVRTAEMAQAQAGVLTGETATTHGLSVTVIDTG